MNKDSLVKNLIIKTDASGKVNKSELNALDNIIVKAGDQIKFSKLFFGEEKNINNLIVLKKGEDLEILFENGQVLTLEAFYSFNNVELEFTVSDNSVYTLSSLSDGGVFVSEVVQLVYAQGDQSVLMSLSDDSALHAVLSNQIQMAHSDHFAAVETAGATGAEAAAAGGAGAIGGISTAALVVGGLVVAGAAIAASNSSSSSSTTDTSSTGSSSTTSTAYFVDSAVSGVTYTRYLDGEEVSTGTTDADGKFEYEDGETVTFEIAGITLGSMDTDDIQEDGNVMPQDILNVSRADVTNTSVTAMAKLLQTLDSDGDASNGITVETNNDGDIITDNGATIVAKADLLPEGTTFDATSTNTFLTNNINTSATYDSGANVVVKTDVEAQAHILGTVTGVSDADSITVSDAVELADLIITGATSIIIDTTIDLSDLDSLVTDDTITQVQATAIDTYTGSIIITDQAVDITTTLSQYNNMDIASAGNVIVSVTDADTITNEDDIGENIVKLKDIDLSDADTIALDISSQEVQTLTVTAGSTKTATIDILINGRTYGISLSESDTLNEVAAKIAASITTDNKSSSNDTVSSVVADGANVIITYSPSSGNVDEATFTDNNNTDVTVTVATNIDYLTAIAQVNVEQAGKLDITNGIFYVEDTLANLSDLTSTGHTVDLTDAYFVMTELTEDTDFTEITINNSLSVILCEGYDLTISNAQYDDFTALNSGINDVGTLTIKDTIANLATSVDAVPEVQTIDFTSMTQTDGNIIVGGVTVAVLAADNAATTAGKIQTALDGETLTGTSNAVTATVENNVVTLTFDAADGDVDLVTLADDNSILTNAPTPVVKTTGVNVVETYLDEPIIVTDAASVAELEALSGTGKTTATIVEDDYDNITEAAISSYFDADTAVTLLDTSVTAAQIALLDSQTTGIITATVENLTVAEALDIVNANGNNVYDITVTDNPTLEQLDALNALYTAGVTVSGGLIITAEDKDDFSELDLTGVDAIHAEDDAVYVTVTETQVALLTADTGVTLEYAVVVDGDFNVATFLANGYPGTLIDIISNDSTAQTITFAVDTANAGSLYVNGDSNDTVVIDDSFELVATADLTSAMEADIADFMAANVYKDDEDNLIYVSTAVTDVQISGALADFDPADLPASYILSDGAGALGALTIAEAEVVVGAENADDYTYTIDDTATLIAANIGSDTDVITGNDIDVELTAATAAATLEELVAINNATFGEITLNANTIAADYAGTAADLVAAFAGTITTHTGTLIVDDGTATVLQANKLDAASVGIVTAEVTGTLAQLATLTSTDATNVYTATVSTASVDAAELVAANTTTGLTLTVDAAVQTVTATAADIAKAITAVALTSNAAVTIDSAATISVANANLLDAATTGVVIASITETNASTLSTIDDANSNNVYSATLDDTSVDATELVDLNDDLTLTLDAAVVEITSDVADIGINAANVTAAMALTTAENVDVELTSLGTVAVDLSPISAKGAGILTVSADGALHKNTNLGDFTVTVANGADISLEAAQATESTITAVGDAVITVTVLDETLDADLSGLSAVAVNGVIAQFDANGTFTGDLGTAEVAVADSVTLTTTAAIASGVTITVDGTTAGGVTLTALGTTAADLSGITDANGNALLTVDVPTTATLAATTDLGSFAVTVADGEILTATAQQLDGIDITVGTGLVTATAADTDDLTAVVFDSDVSVIDIAGTVTLTDTQAGLVDVSDTGIMNIEFEASATTLDLSDFLDETNALKVASIDAVNTETDTITLTDADVLDLGTGLVIDADLADTINLGEAEDIGAWVAGAVNSGGEGYTTHSYTLTSDSSVTVTVDVTNGATIG
jgi:hypothetical protein